MCPWLDMTNHLKGPKYLDPAHLSELTMPKTCSCPGRIRRAWTMNHEQRQGVLDGGMRFGEGAGGSRQETALLFRDTGTETKGLR